MSSVHEMMPVNRPVSGSIRPPGSKSLTNRALVIAALARGGFLAAHRGVIEILDRDGLSQLAAAPM